jgi:hypothetical protein
MLWWIALGVSLVVVTLYFMTRKRHGLFTVSREGRDPAVRVDLARRAAAKRKRDALDAASSVLR